jgi:hypothetical protein
MKIELEDSFFITLYRKSFMRYLNLKARLYNMNKDSLIYKLFQGLRNNIGVCLKYSFLGRMVDINNERGKLIFEESSLLKYLIDLFKISRHNIMSSLNSSSINSFLIEFRKDIYLSPLKTLSIILVTTTITNISFSILLKKQIGLFTLIIQGLFLFIGLQCISCNVNWQDLKKTSFILKHLRRIN